MILSHEEYKILVCPKIEPEYYDYWEKVSIVEDPSEKEATLVWQELYGSDKPILETAQEIQDIIQTWISNTRFIIEWNSPDSLLSNDLYTKIIGIVLTENQVQIYFQRIFPLYFIANFGKEFFGDDFKQAITNYRNYVQLPPWHPPPDAPLKDLIGGIIGHFRWEPKAFGKRKCCREIFEGLLTPIEYEIQHSKFLDFMKQRFPSWRHL